MSSRQGQTKMKKNFTKGQFRSNDANKNAKKKKSIEDYYFYVGSAKQASDYEVTAEFVLNHIKKTFDHGNDIAESLRLLREPNINLWRPSLRVSLKSDEDERVLETRQFELEYKSELDEATRRIRYYRNNRFKAYALLWERCAKSLQNKIMSRTDYHDVIYNDPIELLRAIKQHALDYQETRYEMSIIADAFRAFFNAKQKEKESLQDYTRRFKTAKEILESHIGGPIVLSKFMLTMEEYEGSDDEQDAAHAADLANKAWEQFSTYIHLENADPSKYGTLLTNLKQQKSLGNDQYPKTLIESTHVLSNHRFDFLTYKTPRPQQDKTKTKANQYKEEAEVQLSFTQLDGKCYCCGKAGHKSPQSHHKNKIPKDEWAINKDATIQYC